MIDKEKIYSLLGRHIGFVKGGYSGIDPNVEDAFWQPMIEELSKDVDETIAFIDELDQIEFQCTLEILDELIEKTQSLKLLEAVKKIGKEKHINKVYLDNSVERASYWLND